MGDISLNTIISNPKTTVLAKKKAHNNINDKTLRKLKASENAFSFQFTNNDKIRAVVARRRIKPGETQKMKPTITKNVFELKNEPITAEVKSAIPRRKNYVSNPNLTTEDDIDINISLNVVTNTSSLPIKKAPKLSQHDRMEKKREERRATQNNSRKDVKVLSQKEIDEGLKIFCEPATQRNAFKSKEIDVGLNKFAEPATQRNAFKSKEMDAGLNKFAEPATQAHTTRPNNMFKEKSFQNREIRKTKIINLFDNKNQMDEELIGQRFVKPIVEKVFSSNTEISLTSLNLHPHCIKNLKDLLNISQLTTVQQKTIPLALEGKNLLVRSQTGSGKTLGYALPIVQKLQEIRPKLARDGGVLALIIVPTRELVIQCYELFVKLLKPFIWIIPGMLTGGEKRKMEKARLRKGINVLIGTPGRLVDHLLHTESFKLDKLQMLILDEADKLLEMGYERDVKRIVEGIGHHKSGKFLKLESPNDGSNPFRVEQAEPEVDRNLLVGLQILLLSATLTSAIKNLAGLALKNPIFIENSEENSIPSNVNYEEAIDEAITESKLVIPENLQLSYLLVPPKLRLVILSGLIAKEFQNKTMKAIVFMSTTEMVNFHHDLLNETLTQKVLDDEESANESENDDEPLLMGIRFFRLNGSMTQPERMGVFKSFRSCKTGILLTTDVSGRGIDIPEVDLVVQYSPPQKIYDFVHRVGRTARAGKSGRAILFLSPLESAFVRIIEDKRIRISQILMDRYLEPLHKHDSEANTVQEAASNLQHKFEELIKEDREMKDKACKAYVSWIKFYSTFPKDLKNIFNIKIAHMGHFAKSFGLRDPPTNFAHKHSIPKEQLPSNRLTYTERNPQKIKADKSTTKKRQFTTKVGLDNSRLKKLSQKSMALTTSEFDSGIQAKKKRY